MHRLRIIVRTDLEPGPQAAQAVHAALAWQAEHPELASAWGKSSNTVAILAAPRAVLEELRGAAGKLGIPSSAFHEPDMGNELTALALGPGPKARRLCRRLPMAGEEERPRRESNPRSGF